MRVRPCLVEVTRPARSSTARCWANDGNAMSNGSASADVAKGPDTSRSMTRRRVGSARALRASSTRSPRLAISLSITAPGYLGQHLCVSCGASRSRGPKRGDLTSSLGARGWAGLSSHRATTTATVTERPDLDRDLYRTLIIEQWSGQLEGYVPADDAEFVTEVEDFITAVQSLGKIGGAGAIVRREGARYRVRVLSTG